MSDSRGQAGELPVRMPVGDDREETDDSCCVLRPLYQFATEGRGIGMMSYFCLKNYDGVYYNIAALCQTNSGNTILFPGTVPRRIREIWFGDRLGGQAFAGISIDHLTMNPDHVRWHITSRAGKHFCHRVRRLNDFTSYWFGMSTPAADVFERTCRIYKIKIADIDNLDDRLASVYPDLDESCRNIFRLPEPTQHQGDHYLHFDILIHHGSSQQLVSEIMNPPTQPVSRPDTLTLTVPLLTGGRLVMVGCWVQGSIPDGARLGWLEPRAD